VTLSHPEQDRVGGARSWIRKLKTASSHTKKTVVSTTERAEGSSSDESDVVSEATPQALWCWPSHADAPEPQDLRMFLTGKPMEHVCISLPEDVCIPTLDTTTTPLRTAQLYAEDAAPSQEWCHVGVMESLLHMDPDVIALNEFHWYGNALGEDELQVQLQAQGYTLHFASVFAPIAVACRLPVQRVEEIVLDDEHSAIVLQVELPRYGDGKETAWLCAAKLCDYDNEGRQAELGILLDWLRTNTSALDRVILIGDVLSSVDEFASDIANGTSALTDAGFVASSASTTTDSATVHCRNFEMRGEYESEVEWTRQRMMIQDWSL
jgi:hypothetical protein